MGEGGRGRAVNCRPFPVPGFEGDAVAVGLAWLFDRSSGAVGRVLGVWARAWPSWGCIHLTKQHSSPPPFAVPTLGGRPSRRISVAGASEFVCCVAAAA